MRFSGGNVGILTQERKAGQHDADILSSYHIVHLTLYTLNTMAATSLLLALFAALLLAASAFAGSIIPLSQVCNSPNVHCILCVADCRDAVKEPAS